MKKRKKNKEKKRNEKEREKRQRNKSDQLFTENSDLNVPILVPISSGKEIFKIENIFFFAKKIEKLWEKFYGKCESTRKQWGKRDASCFGIF